MNPSGTSPATSPVARRMAPQAIRDLRSTWQRTRTLLARSNDAGQSAVEFALCLPVLLLVVTGILTFGLAINNFIVLTDATGVSARQLAISRGQTTDPCATTVTAFYAAAPLLARSGLTFAFSFNGVAYSGTSCNSSSTTTGAAGNLAQGTSAQVTVSYPCSTKVYGHNFTPNSCVLQAQTAELVQ